jgi:hypothetical protein
LVGVDDELSDTAQALSVLEKALRDALAVIPLEQVLEKVTVMFPRSRVEIDTARLHTPVQKVSVSMPKDLIDAVRERTGPGGFSRYVTEAVEDRLIEERQAEFTKWLIETYGEPSAEDLEWAEGVFRSVEEEE